ncbi:MAG: hypothetical protein R8P61_01500 [Bacteroidia bacterium]|nr:hypothetical protein [Bacteroidia bacterium]
MDILKIANEWAKDEIFSSKFFILFGLVFLAASIGFWQLGKTETARAFIYPTLVAGILVLAVGLGLFFTNKSRLNNFATAYNSDPTAFVKAEISRAEKTVGEFQTVVFKAIPIIIAIAALLIIFVDKPLWRAISITTIAMMAVILMVDSNSSTRIDDYRKQLELVDK